jgi:hypothetical protein
MNMRGALSSLERMSSRGLPLNNGYDTRSMPLTHLVGHCSATLPSHHSAKTMVTTRTSTKRLGSWRRSWKSMSRGLVRPSFSPGTNSPLPTLFTCQEPTTQSLLTGLPTCMTQGRTSKGGGTKSLLGAPGSRC